MRWSWAGVSELFTAAADWIDQSKTPREIINEGGYTFVRAEKAIWIANESQTGKAFNDACLVTPQYAVSKGNDGQITGLSVWGIGVHLAASSDITNLYLDRQYYTIILTNN